MGVVLLLVPLNVYADEIYPILISATPDGEAGNDRGSYGIISGDGKFVAFMSPATDLVENDGNHQSDVFLRDLLNKETTMISVKSDGSQGAYTSIVSSINYDGRYTVFATQSKLVPEDTNERSDVYMYDRNTKQVTWISKPVTEDGDGGGGGGKITSDGQKIFFGSDTESLGFSSPGNENLFVWDKNSENISAVAKVGSNYNLSGDTKKIIYLGPTESTQEGYADDLFVYDTITQETILITKSIDEFPTFGGSRGGMLDYEGNFAVFSSMAPNLVHNDSNDELDFFIHDLQTSTTKLLNVDLKGERFPAKGQVKITSDGQFVILSSYNGISVYDVKTEKITNISLLYPASFEINDDGSFIVFVHNISERGVRYALEQVQVTTNPPPSDIVTGVFEEPVVEEPVVEEPVVEEPVVEEPVVEEPRLQVRGTTISGSSDFDTVNITITNSEGQQIWKKSISVDQTFEITMPRLEDGKYTLSMKHGAIGGELEIKEFRYTGPAPVGNFELEIELPDSSAEDFDSFATKNRINNFERLMNFIRDSGEPERRLEVIILENQENSGIPRQDLDSVTRFTSDGLETLEYGIAWTTFRAYNDIIGDARQVLELMNNGMSLDAAIDFLGIIPTPESEPTPEPEVEEEMQMEETVEEEMQMEETVEEELEQIECEAEICVEECNTMPNCTVTWEPEPEELGIATFVDKSKDPQSYIDRYNSEPSYKKWFHDNYPEYDSIEQAVGLELTEKIPSWVKNIFGWYATDQVSEDELLNAIKYLINEGILIVD